MIGQDLSCLIFLPLAKTILLKLAPLVLPLFLLAVAGCRDEHHSTNVVRSPDYEKGLSLLVRQPDSAYYHLNKAATE
jgi:hypothetical protein